MPKGSYCPTQLGVKYDVPVQLYCHCCIKKDGCACWCSVVAILLFSPTQFAQPCVNQSRVYFDKVVSTSTQILEDDCIGHVIQNKDYILKEKQLEISM